MRFAEYFRTYSHAVNARCLFNPRLRIFTLRVGYLFLRFPHLNFPFSIQNINIPSMLSNGTDNVGASRVENIMSKGGGNLRFAISSINHGRHLWMRF